MPIISMILSSLMYGLSIAKRDPKFVLLFLITNTKKSQNKMRSSLRWW